MIERKGNRNEKRWGWGKRTVHMSGPGNRSLLLKVTLIIDSGIKIMILEREVCTEFEWDP